MGGVAGKDRQPNAAKRAKGGKKSKIAKAASATPQSGDRSNTIDSGTISGPAAVPEPATQDIAHIGAVIAVQTILINAGLSTADVAKVGATTFNHFACRVLPWFMGAVELAGPAVPFFAPVFTLLTRAYGAACAMKDVRVDAAELQARLADLAAVLWDGYQRRNSTGAEPTDMQQKYLDRLREVLERVVVFLTKYGKEGKLTEFLKSSAHAEQLRQLDTDLTKAVADKALFDIVALAKRIDIVETGLKVAADDIGAIKGDVIEIKVAVKSIGDIKAAFAELRDGKNMLTNFQLILRRQHPKLLKVQPDELVAGLDVYVPLHFGLRKPPLADGERRFELDELATALLQGTTVQIAECADGDTGHGSQCVFMQGVAGTGKSLLGWRMAQMYDQLPVEGGVQERARIPIIINLPMVADAVRAALSETNKTGSGDFLLTQLLHAYDNPALEEAHQAMEPQQRAALCETGFVFVLDGVDELGDKLPIHKLVSLRQWPNSVFVVAARTGFFSNDREGLKRVCPRDAAGGLLESQMRAIHLLSFDEQQRNNYITAFAGRYGDIYEGWDTTRYHDALKAFPQLNEFLTEPLLLFMVLNVLPLLTSSSGRLRMDPLSLGVVEVADAGVEGAEEDGFYAYPVVKRAQLYALFTYSWAKREAAKLQLATVEFIQGVTQFSEVLAFHMFKKGTTQMSLVSEEDVVLVRQAGKATGVVSQQQRKARAAVASADAFLMSLLHPAAPDSDGKQLEFRCSPIKRTGNMVSFLHKTVQEFFTAMHVIRNLNDSKERDDGAVWQADVQQGGYFCQPDRWPYIAEKLLTAGNVSNTLRFCADLVDTRVQRYVTFGPGSLTSGFSATQDWIQPASMALWDIVQASRLPAAREPAAHDVAATAAANALMVLNAAGLQFDGCDFSNAVLGPAAGTVLSDKSSIADVSGGIFSHCNFSGSILRHARLDGCAFTGSCLTNAVLTGAILGQLPMLLGHTEEVTSVCVTSDSKHIVSGSADKSLRIWSLESGQEVRHLGGHSDWVTSVCVTPDGKHIVSGSFDHSVRVWSLESGQQVRHLDGHTDRVWSVCVTSDGKHVVSGSEDKSVRVWSLESGQELRRLDGHIERVWSVCVMPDGKHIVSGSEDKSIRVWSLESGQQVHHLVGHIDRVTCVCVTPDGKHIVSGSSDNSVRVWSLESGQQVHHLDGHANWVTSVCVTLDGKHIVSGFFDHSVRVWSLESGQQVRHLDGHTDRVWSVCVTLDGKHIVSGSSDKSVRVWSLESGQEARYLADSHTGGVTMACVTPDGKHVVSGSEDKSVRLWSLESGQQVRHLDGHIGRVTSVCVTFDSKYVVSGSEDKSVRVWSLESGLEVRHLDGHTDTVTSVCVTPDGKHAVSGSEDKSVRVWSLETGQQVRQLDGHAYYVTCVCMTRDGKHVVSGSADKSVRVWSLESGQQVHRLDGHNDRVCSVCVTSDGKHIVSGSEDKSVRVWSLESGDFVREGDTKDLTSAGQQSAMGNVEVYLDQVTPTAVYVREATRLLYVLGNQSALSFNGCQIEGLAASDTCMRLISQLAG